MAIPKSLKKIPTEKAESIISKHTRANTGYWEGTPWLSDFIYPGRMTKYGYRRDEMIRPCGNKNFEVGVVAD